MQFTWFKSMLFASSPIQFVAQFVASGHYLNRRHEHATARCVYRHLIQAAMDSEADKGRFVCDIYRCLTALFAWAVSLSCIGCVVIAYGGGPKHICGYIYLAEDKATSGPTSTTGLHTASSFACFDAVPLPFHWFFPCIFISTSRSLTFIFYFIDSPPLVFIWLTFLLSFSVSITCLLLFSVSFFIFLPFSIYFSIRETEHGRRDVNDESLSPSTRKLRSTTWGNLWTMTFVTSSLPRRPLPCLFELLHIKGARGKVLFLSISRVLEVQVGFSKLHRSSKVFQRMSLTGLWKHQPLSCIMRK